MRTGPTRKIGVDGNNRLSASRSLKMNSVLRRALPLVKGVAARESKFVLGVPSSAIPATFSTRSSGQLFDELLDKKVSGNSSAKRGWDSSASASAGASSASAGDLKLSEKVGEGKESDDKLKAREETGASPDMDEFHRSYGTGRRKTGVARVWLKEGSGQFTVNDKAFHDYFSTPRLRREIMIAFDKAGMAGQFDVWCTVTGGGIMGQAGAVRLGVARAMEKYSPSLRPVLSRAGMLTRDPRRVERKKPGQKKARKKFQWVKR
jgi:small subunit ribosomal protein S9